MAKCTAGNGDDSVRCGALTTLRSHIQIGFCTIECATGNSHGLLNFLIPVGNGIIAGKCAAMDIDFAGSRSINGRAERLPCVRSRDCRYSILTAIDGDVCGRHCVILTNRRIAMRVNGRAILGLLIAKDGIAAILNENTVQILTFGGDRTAGHGQ